MKCGAQQDDSKYDFDLAIIGSGAAAFAAAIKAVELGKSVALIEKETLGGTCVNVGCVPSKYLIRAAEAKHRAEYSPYASIKPLGAQLDFAQLIYDKQQLVESLRHNKYQSVLNKNKSIHFIQGVAKFLDHHKINVSGKVISAAKILIATGSQPFIPSIAGLEEAGYLTSTSAFELAKLPSSMAILGGGYIALELAQMFQRLGTQVTIIQRSRILFHEDHDLSSEISKHLELEGVKILNGTIIKKVRKLSQGVAIELQSHNSSYQIKVDHLVVATGRVPNVAGLELEKAGVMLNDAGYIAVNEFLQTSQDHIYAAGDVLASPALVYVAAYEGHLAAENAFLQHSKKVDYSTVPWVIFTDPQVAGVGFNEAQARSAGLDYDVSLLTMDHVPRAITAQDTRGYIKLLRKTRSDELIGARVVAPEGSEIIMELSLMIKYKLPISEIASMMHPYLTLSEAVKLALQTFDKDVKELSCCAN